MNRQAPQEWQTRLHTVYCLFDSRDVPVYVGCTFKGLNRLAQHQATQPWFYEVATAAFEHFNTRDEALDRERELIQRMAPRRNRRSNPDPVAPTIKLPGATA